MTLKKTGKELVKMKLSDLVPYELNNKDHPKKQIEVIKESIKRAGYQTEIRVDENNIILCGHGRKLALEELGETEAEVIKVTWLTDEEKEAFRLLDNRTSDLSVDNDKNINLVLSKLWDEILLKIYGKENEIKLTSGEGDDEIEELDEEKEAVLVELWDVFKLWDHTIVCGDCTKAEDLEKLLGDNKIDILITDPPYGVDYSSKNEFLNNKMKGNKNQDEILNDNITEYRAFFRDFLSIIPFSDYNTFYIFISGKEIHNLYLALQDVEFYASSDLVWVKNNHVLGRQDYNSRHENIIYGWKGKHKFYGNFRQSVFDEGNPLKDMDKNQLIKLVNQYRNAENSTIIREDKPLKSDLHPTMKPVALVTKLMLDGSNPGFNVYDPFIGSGTTLISAEKTKRICFGMELNPKNVQTIIKRFYKFTNGEKQIECLNRDFNFKEILWEK